MFPSNYPLLQQSQPQLTAVNQGRFLGRIPSSSYHCQQQRQLQSLLHKSTTTTSSMRAPSTVTRSVKAVMPMKMNMNMNAMTRRSMGHAAHTHGPSRRNIGAAVGLVVVVMGALAYARSQEDKGAPLRRRTTHVYPAFMPDDGKSQSKK